MTTESLQQIIAAEHELQASEEAENARAARWLAEQEEAIRAEFARRREGLAGELEAVRLRARETAEIQAAAKLDAARERARRLAALSDASLRQILARHLAALVAGSGS